MKIKSNDEEIQPQKEPPEKEDTKYKQNSNSNSIKTQCFIFHCKFLVEFESLPQVTNNSGGSKRRWVKMSKNFQWVKLSKIK